MSVLSSVKGVQEIMRRHNLYARKGLGQNFLIDQNILTRIAESAELDKGQYVVEIGPGLGALSTELAARSRGLLCIDIDQRLETVLEETLAGFNNIRILFQDILKTDIESALTVAFQLQEIVAYKVCANIPYNITSPIIFKLLESCPLMHSAILMMQKEVAQRILAQPGSKEYGRLTIAVAYHAKVEHVLNVSRNCFYPRPEVDSAILKFIPYRQKMLAPEEEIIFKNILNIFFQQRRKIILNSLTNYFQIDKSIMEEILHTIDLDPNLRPENLALQDYITLVRAISQIPHKFY
ncbi:MAG: ribosomal RNA small subunit methyltransferase A [Syntrophomonadaceae bacterium]|nr:ribosomal RNA small subunit methyltransferase A [Syntrophomonadaceae bacterium]